MRRLNRLLDRLDQATRTAQYLAAFAYGLICDEIAIRRLRRRGG